MGTTTIDVTKNEWVQVADSASGSLFVQKGSDVALTQADELPTTAVADTPLMCVLKLLEDKVYYGVGDGSAIYARSLTGSSKLTNTPAE